MCKHICNHINEPGKLIYYFFDVLSFVFKSHNHLNHKYKVEIKVKRVVVVIRVQLEGRHVTSNVRRDVTFDVHALTDARGNGCLKYNFYSFAFYSKNKEIAKVVFDLVCSRNE